MEVIKDYLENSSFHGLRFLTEPRRHITERLFWLACILTSWYFCFTLVVSSYDGYVNNALSFGTDTNYINWNTSFFAVGVCEYRNRPPVYDLGKNLFGPTHDFNLDEVLLEIAYFKGDHYFTKSFCAGGTKGLPCPQGGFKAISDAVRTNCSGVFHKCSWKGNFFNCCRYFQALETEKGLCFAINSLLTKNPKIRYDMVCNKLTGPGKLRLELKVPSDVYILGPEEVPFINAHSHTVVTSAKGIHKGREFTVTGIVNGPMVSSVPLAQRKCRFKEENPLKFHKYYSYMACIVECREARQSELCGCVQHLSPGVETSKHCNLTGLLCLIDKFSNYSVLVNPWNTRGGLSCNCLPSCTEPEVNLISRQEYRDSDVKNYGVVELSLHALPTLRLKRTVVKGPLDLVVSMGGSAGLFVGASLLSFVELFYFCSVRPWWNYRMKKKAAMASVNTTSSKGVSSFINDGISTLKQTLQTLIFWFLCVVFSWYLSMQLIISFWESFKYRPVSFVTETDYVHWNTSLFAVSVCEDQNDQKIASLHKKMYGARNYTFPNIDEVFLEIAYFRGTGVFIKKFCLDVGEDCPNGNLGEIASMARSSCEELFRGCSWLDEFFDCCQYFQPISTELGPCFSINSLQTRKQKPFPMVMSNSDILGTIRFQLSAASNVYIHSPEDVPFLSGKENEVLLSLPGLYKKVTFRVLETVNEPLVREVDINTRQCRFPDENPLKQYQAYSYRACVVECRMNLQLSLCNCSSHLLTTAVRPCDLQGLQCLQTHLQQHTPLHAIAQACDHCVPSCTDNEYEQTNYETYGGLGGYAELELGFSVLPAVRLKRQVVRSTLDLVVSVGGSVGLFVGASMLSFVEVFYYLFIKCCWDTLSKKKKKNIAVPEAVGISGPVNEVSTVSVV